MPGHDQEGRVTPVTINATAEGRASVGVLPVAGALRVGNGLRLPGTGGGGGAVGKARTAGDEKPKEPPYIEGLVKLFPVEGVTLLPMVPVIAKGSLWWTYGLVVVIMAIIVFLRWHETRSAQTGKPDKVAIGIALISFLLYAATLQTFGLVFPNDAPRHTTLMSFITVIWVAAVPKFPQRGGSGGVIR